MAITLKNKNFGVSKLLSGITAVATQLTVLAGEGSKFPTSGSFRAVIWSQSYDSPIQDGTREIVTMQVSAGDVFTITRAQESTTAKAWNANDNVAHVITAGKVDELEAEINAKKTDNVSAMDKVLGRASAGAGAIEEIGCTAAARSILDDATIQAIRTTLGVGTEDSPAFAGATIGTLAGVIRGIAGVLSALEYVAWTTPAFDAGDFTASGSMTWTVDSGDVVTYSYMIIGKLMVIAINISYGTIGGTPSTLVYIKIPASKVATRATNAWAMIYNNGAWAHGRITIDIGNTKIGAMVDIGGGTNWTAGDNSVRATLFFEIN